MSAVTTGGSHFTFRDDAERDRTRILAARLLVRQARLLKHRVEPDVAADAQRSLPEEVAAAS